MEPVYRFRENQPVSWFAADKRRSNRRCLYCGDDLGPGSSVPSSREHLIARNFVPAGTLDETSFNFIFRACTECNGRKADAERHVSTVTLLTSQGRDTDPLINSAATHKASRDFHPTTRALVRDSTFSRTIEGHRGPGVVLSFGVVGPPQLEPGRVALLACNQIQALFALVTTRDPTSSQHTSL